MSRPFNAIVLIGFMAAGKTTVGRELAQRLGWRFVDLDQLIEEQSGRRIAEIFASDGEEAFRHLETQTLDVLDTSSPLVVSTGGGIVGREDNWRLMHRLGPIVYLEVSWPLLRQRLEGETGRPLGRGDAGWDAVQQRLEQRQPLYARADVRLACDHDSPARIADRILDCLFASRSPQ